MFELELEKVRKETTELWRISLDESVNYRTAAIHYFDLCTRSDQLEACSFSKLLLRSGMIGGACFATLIGASMTISRTSPYEALSLFETGSKLLLGLGGGSFAWLGIKNNQKQKKLLDEFHNVKQFQKELQTSYEEYLEAGCRLAMTSFHYGTTKKKQQCLQVLASVVREEEENFSITHFHLREKAFFTHHTVRKDFPHPYLFVFDAQLDDSEDAVCIKETENPEKALVFSDKTLYTNNSKFWKRNSNKS